MPEKRDRILRRLEAKLGYRFRNRALLDQALTHRSFVHENPDSTLEDNERMEFLGDAILGFCVSDMLLRTHEHFTEGQLSKARASLVKEGSLSIVAGMIGLGDYVRLGKGEEASGGKTRVSTLADTLEAVVAAIYMDGGLRELTGWFHTFFVPLLERNPEKFRYADYKTALQQVAQKKFRDIPAYTLIGSSGPDHRKLFEVRLVTGNIVTQGTGRTKKEAEQGAARQALALIEDDGGEKPK
jgi:ribonuclease III